MSKERVAMFRSMVVGVGSIILAAIALIAVTLCLLLEKSPETPNVNKIVATETQEITHDFPLPPPEFEVKSDWSMENFVDHLGYTQTIYHRSVEVNGRPAIESYSMRSDGYSLVFLPESQLEQ